jgi:hypothetical protein
MSLSPELRERCASRLLTAVERASQLTAFAGLDGFVDEIVHVVDTRENAEAYQRMPSIARLAERIAEASGKSTNIELVNQLVKLGGNGPILANALASFGLKVTYLGALGYPNRHAVFDDFANRAEVHSIAESGQTDALEFEDGKVMISRTVQLNEITWANIQARFGRDEFAIKFASSDLIAFVNWTMIPYLSDVWESMQKELCPALGGPRRQMFFDLCDPVKRLPQDILRALKLIGDFEKHFVITLGLNEKEAYEIGEVLGLDTRVRTREGLSQLAVGIRRRVAVNTLVVHPVKYALAVSEGKVSAVDGPFVPKPRITTGAGDHFNAGFCLGKLLGFDNELSLLTGVSTSGYYVRTAVSPGIVQLTEFLRRWPEKS